MTVPRYLPPPALALARGIPEETVRRAASAWWTVDWTERLHGRPVWLPEVDLANGTAVDLLLMPWPAIIGERQRNVTITKGSVFVGIPHWTGWWFTPGHTISERYVQEHLAPAGRTVASECDATGLGLVLGVALQLQFIGLHVCPRHPRQEDA